MLLSGGLDSYTAAAVAKRDGFDLFALSIDYGQRHSEELAASRAVAKSLAVRKHLELALDLTRIGGSALTSGQIDVPKDQPIDPQVIPSTYVPARNTIFLSVALGWAEVLGAADIVIGVNALDYSGYPDCRPEFLAAFEEMLARAMPDPPTVVAPLVELTKPQIAALAQDLGIGPGDTWSCYDPQLGADGVTPCRVCDACKLHAYAWEQANNQV